MSLTKFIKNPNVLNALRVACPKPRFIQHSEIVAPPRTKRHALVGTAFDYLFRWTVERANPKWTEASAWIAEDVAKRLPPKSRLGRTAQRIVREARERHKKYIAGGPLSNDLLADCLRLGRLDAIYRSGCDCVTPEELNLQDPLDVEDLAAIASAIPINRFRARRRCRLNPSFGVASAMVGGADGDLRIDDRLVDVKTTKQLVLTEHYIHQLIGYVVLERLDPEWRGWAGKPVAHVEVFFARFGIIASFPLGTLVAPDALDKLCKEFEKYASTKDARLASLTLPSSVLVVP